MTACWFVSDTHFGHNNILKFTRNDGKPLREFASIEEHDETLVKNWNDRVGPNDRIYHMGDVAINRRCLKILSRLNGKKVLIKGNHDIFPLKDYLPYFEDIRAYRVFSQHGLIVSHVPVHTCQLEGRFKVNAHGHLHSNFVNEVEYWAASYRLDEWTTDSCLESESKPDKRYINCCVEHTDYAPITLEEILQKANQ